MQKYPFHSQYPIDQKIPSLPEFPNIDVISYEREISKTVNKISFICVVFTEGISCVEIKDWD
jgi:hypothetical protein